MNEFVNKAIINTNEYLHDYLIKTLQQRLATGAGSCYEQFKTTDELLSAIKNADWEETTHPCVSPDCRVFKANLEGRFGLINIKDVCDDAVLIADDRKHTGYISVTIKGARGRIEYDSYLIIGKENINGNNIEVLFTFHPGEPIKPSNIKVSNITHGSIISKKEAIKLGIKWIKII